MHNNAKPATPTEKRRMEKIADIGCIAHFIDGFPSVPCDNHHMLNAGQRIGHDCTIGLSPWHHRGQPFPGLSVVRMTETHGPSMALNRPAFVRHYGTELELLTLQNKLLEVDVPVRMEMIGAYRKAHGVKCRDARYTIRLGRSRKK